MDNKNTVHELELMQARIDFVPEGWSFSKIADVFRVRNNLRKPISEEERSKNPGPYPYYGPTKIQDYIGSYCQDGAYALIGEDGDHFLKFRHQKMTQLVDGKCTVNNHAHIIEGTGIACREWFYYYFMNRDIFSFLTRQGAGRFKLNKAALEKIPLLIPPIDEQRKIATILSTWDEAITSTELLLAKSKQQKKALMQQLLTGKKRLPGFDQEWRELTLGQLFSERREVGSTGLPLLSVTSEHGIINRNDVGRKDTSSADKSKYLKVCPGDIAYNTMRMWQGVSSLSSLEGIVSPAYTVLKPEYGMESRYASYLFKLPKIIHLFYRHSQGLVSDTWNLKFKHFSRIKVFVPDPNEQKAIAAILAKQDEAIHSLKRQIEQLRQEKRALMQQLLTGKRRVLVVDA
ncbi:hypothetical protein A15D_01394 [Alcanivorax sp. MD8A]|uniref:restriction endonuclease subunit S n=1 Tax=Alcanivorax sp. MD8A TaxID=1177157 RepID=UPI000C9A3D03|nr:restriction endonuclease subunit S [Alcanivorax sp. MD8A]PNE02991.1 hypothetical protein A15D_01394 [Alcanivorax sp. MD8A]